MTGGNGKRMGRDNQPKFRQATELARRAGQRAGYDRILIVSEGSKTEPLYLGEIRAEYRLNTANVQVQPSQFGTTPLQVVEYAEHLFVEGNKTKNIERRAFEKVYAVFDRDDHTTYHDALKKADALDRKQLRNDLRRPVQFAAIASVPCFELWLLLHFENALHPLHRTEVYQRMRHYVPGYDKGQVGHYKQTNKHLTVAMQRARDLTQRTTAHNGAELYTDLHHLVSLLTTLKD